MQKKLVFMLTLLALVLVSCAPGAGPQNAEMNSKPTEERMKDPMDEKATVTSLPVTGGDAMMEKTSTLEMMDKEMMDATGTPEMMEKTHDPMMKTETPQAGMMDKDDSMMESPVWYSTDLTDAGTGETFQIEDFKGKVVLVETFAQWCPTCLRQQKEFVRLHELLGMPDDLLTISLDVDPNENAEMLQGYLEKHSFDWRFAVAPAETIREIGSLYGQQFLNPPSAPVLIIDREGEAHSLPFGVKSAEDLQEALKPYLESGM
jgi:thiol-disulfide isomerase/thioredoxin